MRIQSKKSIFDHTGIVPFRIHNACPAFRRVVLPDHGLARRAARPDRGRVCFAHRRITVPLGLDQPVPPKR
jgi:hypothetical protein